MKYAIILWSIIFTCASCFSEHESSERSDKIDPKKEIATDVIMTYTDSAKLKFRIVTPKLETYREDDKLIEEYPDGLEIEFYDEKKEIVSSINAEYARRISKDGIMILREYVELVNAEGDQLVTRGITWNEVEHTLETTKFVELVKVATRDTFFGFGFYAKDDFSRFRITDMKGKRRYRNLSEEFGAE